MGQCDGQQDRKTQGYRDHAGGAGATDYISTVYDRVRIAGQAKVMGHSGAHYHTQHSDSGVAIALTGQNQLPQRAASQQNRAPARQRHAQEGPEVLGVSDGLTEGGEVVVPLHQIAHSHS